MSTALLPECVGAEKILAVLVRRIYLVNREFGIARACGLDVAPLVRRARGLSFAYLAIREGGGL